MLLLQGRMAVANCLELKYHSFIISPVPYGFDCDFADQSTKLGTITPYDVLSNFRRGAT